MVVFRAVGIILVGSRSSNGSGANTFFYHFEADICKKNTLFSDVSGGVIVNVLP
jgi:hypothetical protein